MPNHSTGKRQFKEPELAELVQCSQLKVNDCCENSRAMRLILVMSLRRWYPLWFLGPKPAKILTEESFRYLIWRVFEYRQESVRLELAVITLAWL